MEDFVLYDQHKTRMDSGTMDEVFLSASDYLNDPSVDDLVMAVRSSQEDLYFLMVGPDGNLKVYHDPLLEAYVVV